MCCERFHCGIKSLDVADLETTATFTFEAEQPDMLYQVVLTRASESIAGTGALAVVSIAKTTADFTVTFATAPGAGKSATWDFLVCRGT